jgi:hypothetical protein
MACGGCLSLSPQARENLEGRPLPVETTVAKPRPANVVRADRITHANAHEILDALRDELDHEALR